MNELQAQPVEASLITRSTRCTCVRARCVISVASAIMLEICGCASSTIN